MKRLTAAIVVIAIAVLPLAACFKDDLPETVYDSSRSANVECRTVATRYGGELLLVRAAVDGVDGWFVLESATAYVVVDSRYVALEEDAIIGKGAFPRPCKTPVTFYSIDSLSVGPLTIEHANIGAADLSVIEDAVGEPVMGVMGFSLFKRAVVEIDFDANNGDGRVAVHNPVGYTLERGEWTRLDVAHSEMILPATFERAIKGAFVIDTGYAGNAAIFSAFAVNKQLKEGREFVDRPTLTLCGEIIDRETRIDKFTFAGHTFDKPLVSFMNPGSVMDVGGGRLGGLIGRGFLREFIVVLDASHGRVAMVSRDDSVSVDETPPDE